jgi:hypothetical protein
MAALEEYGERYTAGRLLVDLVPFLDASSAHELAEDLIPRLDAMGSLASATEVREWASRS